MKIICAVWDRTIRKSSFIVASKLACQYMNINSGATINRMNRALLTIESAIFLRKYKKSIDNHLEMRYDIFCQQVKFASGRRIPR